MAKKSTAKKRKAPSKPAAVKKAKKVVKKAKTTVAKKTAPKKLPAAKKAYSKSEMLHIMAERAGITKNQAKEVLEALTDIIHAHLKQGAAGSIKLEGLMKVEKIHKPAKKARKGINPFTGEEMMFKAKPAHNVIKVRALKKLKEMA